MEYMIDVRNVTKKFKNVVVLNNVNIKVKKGTICGLIGKNASGKTVLMKVICGFIIPDAGDVFVANKHIGKDCDFPEAAGVIIENPGFAQYMSGIKNLRSLASIRGKISNEKIKEIMAVVGLDPNDKKWVSKYSLGMRQRLGIAQAIMEDQNILILDEPMNGLDNQGVEEMRELFIKLKNEGKTILLASHSKEDIEVLCDEVYEMDHGVLETVS